METTAQKSEWETAGNRYREERGRADELAELSASCTGGRDGVRGVPAREPDGLAVLP